MPAKKPHVAPRLSLTTQVSLDYFDQVTDLAESLGISRHRLLLTALKIGVPLAAAQLGYKATTQQPKG